MSIGTILRGRALRLLALPFVTAVGIAGPAWAQASGAAIPITAQADIGPSSNSGNRGVLGVNIASGNNNQQAGAIVIAEGHAALSSGAVVQFLDSPNSGGSASAASIGDGAFSAGNGLASVNVAAGNDNQQANLALFGLGTSLATSDALLAQVRGAPEIENNQTVANRHDDTAVLAPSAFGDSRGLMQVNLTAGERNSSANIFTLTVSAGGE